MGGVLPLCPRCALCYASRLRHAWFGRLRELPLSRLPPHSRRPLQAAAPQWQVICTPGTLSRS